MSGRDVEPSVELSLALGLLDILQSRFEDHAEQLCALFGGALHSDYHQLAAIERLVRGAKDALDKESVAPKVTGLTVVK